jgi:mono/diheme cytochrome c family protein
MRSSLQVSAALIVLATATGIFGARAQSATALDAKALSGMQLFNQHCRVCHTKPLLTAAQYGPVLSKSSLGGDAMALRDFIANGAPRMPGFKYSFAPDQLDAVVAYLKTVPTPETPAPAPAAPGGGQANPQAD